MIQKTVIGINDYAMVYEQIVLSAFGSAWRREDPFGLGDADIFRAVDNELNGQNGHNLKFGLSVALRKLQNDNRHEEIAEAIAQLDEEIWSANSLNDICEVMQKIKTLYEQIGLAI